MQQYFVYFGVACPLSYETIQTLTPYLGRLEIHRLDASRHIIGVDLYPSCQLVTAPDPQRVTIHEPIVQEVVRVLKLAALDQVPQIIICMH